MFSLQQDPLPKKFTCLFCNHEESVTVSLDKKAGVGQLDCAVCGQTFQCAINCTYTLKASNEGTWESSPLKTPEPLTKQLNKIFPRASMCMENGSMLQVSAYSLSSLDLWIVVNTPTDNVAKEDERRASGSGPRTHAARSSQAQSTQIGEEDDYDEDD
jgi:hypothetical protein